MADKLTTLLLDALGRAALAPAGTPLVGSRSAPGLFPATAAGRQAARRACDDGLLAVVAADPAGKPDRDLCAATDAGRAYLLRESSPRQVLDDLARAVEARRDQLDGLIAAARQMQTSLDAIKNTIAACGLAAAPPDADWLADLCDHLTTWHETAPGDCPLPDLYRRLTDTRPDLTVGQFHDGLRDLHDRERVYLHPWTGPLYALPEPAFALLIGHEIAYYASARGGPQEFAPNGVTHAFA